MDNVLPLWKVAILKAMVDNDLPAISRGSNMARRGGTGSREVLRFIRESHKLISLLSTLSPLKWEDLSNSLTSNLK